MFAKKVQIECNQACLNCRDAAFLMQRYRLTLKPQRNNCNFYKLNCFIHSATSFAQRSSLNICSARARPHSPIRRASSG